MTPAIEPLTLRLPKDLLVLQPMQGHLDLEPVLLVPGLRCAIGSAEGCAVRLTQSDLVQPEHCVIEVIGRQTMLTEWVPETTWLNDRLVREPRELIPGDRVSLGPFDFRLRLASAEELLYAKLVDREAADTSHVDDVLRLKRAIDKPGREAQPESDLFSELLRESASTTDEESHERLTQHISKLLGDLQNQVLMLHEREADLNEQLRRQQEAEPCAAVPPSPVSADSLPGSVRPDYEQVLQLLQAERDQLDRERSEFAEEQARGQEQQLEWSRRLETLESQLTELESQRSAVKEANTLCSVLAKELLSEKAQMDEWDSRLRREESELAIRRIELDRRDRELQELSERQVIDAQKSEAVSVSGKLSGIRRGGIAAGHSPESVDPELPVASAKPLNVSAIELTPHRSPMLSPPLLAVSENSLPDNHWSEPEPEQSAFRPYQSFLTLIAFGISAVFLGTDLGNPAVTSTVGWSTALIGALSTVDLLFHRCFGASR